MNGWEHGMKWEVIYLVVFGLVCFFSRLFSAVNLEIWILEIPTAQIYLPNKVTYFTTDCVIRRGKSKQEQ